MSLGYGYTFGGNYYNGALTYYAVNPNLKWEATTTAGREMRYGWGRADELRDITYPGGMRTSYDYDDALRLVGLHANGLDATYEYDESDNLSARGYSNGTGVRLGHDARGRLTMEGATGVVNVDQTDCERPEYAFGCRMQLHDVNAVVNGPLTI